LDVQSSIQSKIQKKIDFLRRHLAGLFFPKIFPKVTTSLVVPFKNQSFPTLESRDFYLDLGVLFCVFLERIILRQNCDH
jgi:hypothetical protein